MRTSLLLFLSFIFISSALAEEKVIIVTNDYFPYTSTNPSVKGVILEIADRAFKESDVKVTFEFYPWKRCVHYVEKGKVFATTPFLKTEERVKKFYFSKPVTLTYNRFFYNIKSFPNGFKWQKLEDFREYILGGTLGYWYMDEYKKAGLTIYHSQERKNFLLLFKQRVDFVAIDELTGLSLLKESFPERKDKISFVQKPLTIKTYHLMISKKYPASKRLSRLFNRGLLKLIEKGVYADLFRKYNIPKRFAVKF